MATHNKQDYTGHRGVNLNGSTAIRFDSGFAAGTMKADLSEGLNRAYQLPNKSGTFGVTGTFAVNLQAITSWGETAVTVSGIRREDGLIVQIRDMGATVTTGRTFPIIAGARPENGYIYMTFYNPTGTATLYSDIVCSYTAVR